MIISHGRKFIFVHIPKTGGTSLSLALEAKAMKDDILIGDTPKAKNRRGRIKDAQTSGRLWKHSRLTDIYGLVTQEDLEDYFVFTIVRNPWDRMVSYYHWLKDQKFDHPAVRVAQENSFAGFLDDRMIQRGLEHDASRRYVSDQSGVDRCNLYLRMETLEQDVSELEQNLDLKFGELPHDNQSRREKDYKVYYEAHSKDIISAVFSEDIEKFGYKF